MKTLSQKDISHLVPVKKLVTRNGKTFLQTFLVSAEQAKNEGFHNNLHNGEDITEVEDFKQFCKKLTTEQRRQIMEAAKEQGITWKHSDEGKISWMRCSMAIQARLKQNKPFRMPVLLGNKTVKSKGKSDKNPSQLPKPEKVSGSFKTRDEFRTFIKKLTTEQRQFILEDALKQGVTWKRIPDKPATDWMRCAMAIGKHLENGNSYTIGGDKNQPSLVVSPTAKMDNPNQQETPSNKSAEEAPKSKIDELFEKVGLPTEEDNGKYIIGEGVKTIKNKWGQDEIAPGHLRFVDIVPKPEFGSGNWVKLDSAFLDKDQLKTFGARFDVNKKKWYIPFKEFVKTAISFKNIEIAPKIYPTIKAVLEKIPDVSQLLKGDQTSKTINNDDNIDISDFKMPEGMNPELKLYDHQKKAVKFLLQNKKAMAGLAVGLGKTLTSITAAKELINKGEIKRVVVISPASVKFNWKQEIENFSDLKPCVLESSDLRGKKAENKWKEAENSQVVIVNYDMLRKPEIRERLQRLAPDCVIADEAHKLKNDTQQTKGFKETWKNAKYKWFLTATPFPNGQPRETYNMLSHLRPDKVGSWYKDFGKNFVIWENSSYGSRPVQLKNLDKLKEKMRDVVFIRTHNSPDVNSSLPKERHTTYQLEMTKEQKKMYNAISEDILSEISRLEKAGLSASTPVLIAKIKRLEQVAIDPDALQRDPSKINMNKLYPKEEWAVNTITDHLQDTSNRGVVVFCDMKLPLNKIQQGLIKNGIDPKRIAFITGDVKPEERTKVQDKLKSGEVKVVLCTNAAEEGVNLQHGAHTMIHLDVPWVPKTYTQRAGRIQRQGQPSRYTVFLNPIMTGTVEDRKREKLGIKTGVIENLLGEGASGSAAKLTESSDVKALSLSDIKSILGV